MLWSLWWVWVVAAFLIAGLEVLAPGYIFLGFAIGAGLTGGLLALGLFAGSLPKLLVLFAALSVIAWLLLRRFAGVWRGQVRRWDHDIND
jgi:membrane protein implicated in regulation of membrane protease activity